MQVRYSYTCLHVDEAEKSAVPGRLPLRVGGLDDNFWILKELEGFTCEVMLSDLYKTMCNVNYNAN